MLVIPIQQLLSSYLWHSSSSFTCILLFRRDLALLFRIQLGPCSGRLRFFSGSIQITTWFPWFSYLPA